MIEVLAIIAGGMVSLVLTMILFILFFGDK